MSRMTHQEIAQAIANAEKQGPKALASIAAQAIVDLGTIADSLKIIAEQSKLDASRNAGILPQ